MIHVVKEKQLEIYVATDGKKPFVEWLERLPDKAMRYRIKERLDRVALGNFGDHKTVGKGVFELRCAFGPGYRVYYGEVEDIIILLLCGGDKSSQKQDIRKAQLLWEEYLSR